MNIVGLTKERKFIDRYSLYTFPKSLIIVGAPGSGKTLLTNYISEKLKIPRHDITSELNDELIFGIYTNSLCQLYVIDVRQILLQQQNIFLKLLEEPPTNCIVIILANSIFELLPTVINRAILLKIEPYDLDELKKFAKTNNISIDDKYFGVVIRTPGDILKIYSNNIIIKNVELLVDKIVNKIGMASYPNMLSIIDKFNYDDEYDKIDIDFFLKLLYNRYVDKYIDTKELKYYTGALIIRDKLKTFTLNPKLNKKTNLTNMFSKIWELYRGESKWN